MRCAATPAYSKYEKLNYSNQAAVPLGTNLGQFNISIPKNEAK